MDYLFSTVQTDFIPFVEKFHLEYPNTKVIYSLPPFGATINSYKDVDGVKYGRQQLFEKLVSACSELDYVQICPSFIFVDSENGFNTTEVVVNSVYPDYKPNIPNESQFVHPNDGGMYEIGNAVYPYILNTL